MIVKALIKLSYLQNIKTGKISKYKYMYFKWYLEDRGNL